MATKRNCHFSIGLFLASLDTQRAAAERVSPVTINQAVGIAFGRFRGCRRRLPCNSWSELK
jgi:hypothetical protein